MSTATANPAAPAAAPEAPKAKSERKRAMSYQTVFSTEEEVIKACENRTEGPRRPFKITFDKDIKAGTVAYVSGHDERTPFGFYVLANNLGTVTEIGKVKKVRSITPDMVTEVAKGMTDEQKAALLAALGGVPAPKQKK
jgi:hypothetical protein